MSEQFLFASDEGRDFCRTLLRSLMPTDTHDFQLDAIGHLLDGDDVLLVIATGSGKTDMFIRIMHLIQYLATHPHTFHGVSFPLDPAMVIVCPTKALEEEMEAKMKRMNLSALALNADTIAAANNENKNLFKLVRRGVSMVLVSPEQLTSKAFENLINEKPPVFSHRVCMLAVDEAHLMNTWGQSFRKDFLQIGAIRARFPGRLPLAAVTATLQDGFPTHSVTSFLGFQPGRHHIIRRSNSRPDIRLIFRTMKTGLSSTLFPDLHWVVKNKDRRRTLIFGRTVSLGFRIMIDFWSLLADDPNRATRIRLFNAVNDKSYNDQTLVLWQNNDPNVQIIVATSILSVGIDAPTFDDVIVYGEPPDSDEFVQDYGRLRFMKSLSPRAFLYVTKTARSKAEKVLAADQATTGKPMDSSSVMQPSMAKLILAACKVSQLDELYGNYLDEPPCGCSFCEIQPRPQRKPKCDCSGCQKDDEEENVNASEEESVSEDESGDEHAEISDKPLESASLPRNRLSIRMRGHGVEQLTAWRVGTFEASDPRTEGWLYPEAYLPDAVINRLLNVIFSLTSCDDVIKIIDGETMLGDHHLVDLFTVLQTISKEMEEIRTKDKAQQKKRQRNRISEVVLDLENLGVQGPKKLKLIVRDK